jgi:hypothetical protein
MSQASTEAQPRSQLAGVAGRGQQLLNAASGATLVVGVVVFLGGFVVSLHLFATIIGIITLVVGLLLQLLSATRVQRILIIPGVIGAFVGMALGIAHGGF